MYFTRYPMLTMALSTSVNKLWKTMVYQNLQMDDDSDMFEGNDTLASSFKATITRVDKSILTAPPNWLVSSQL